MNNYWFFPGTTVRHNEITGAFVAEVHPLRKKKEVHVLSEKCSLVHWGDKSTGTDLRLIDISEIEDIEDFKESIMGELEYVEPDFMLFKNNPRVENKNQTRTAGQPDFIIEIWSKRNTKRDRMLLQKLYATSNVTEHWYISQTSNKVECYLGGNKIKDQYLTGILKTQSGLEFDLRYLAV